MWGGVTFWLETPKRVSIFSSFLFFYFILFYFEKKEYQLSYKGIVLGNAI